VALNPVSFFQPTRLSKKRLSPRTFVRHVTRRHFSVQDAVRAGEVAAPSVESTRNRADGDVLTKIFKSPAFFEHAIKIFLSAA